jgi:hypothetical protein
MYVATWLVRPALTIFALSCGSKARLNKRANIRLASSESVLAENFEIKGQICGKVELKIT